MPRLGVAVPPKEMNEYYINSDLEAYNKYFDSIRDYIIGHIDTFSTKSLIEAIESYRETGRNDDDEPPDRIRQANDLYHFIKEHPSNVEENERDFILGTLFVCNFDFECQDEFEGVENFLRTNEIDFQTWTGGWYGGFKIRNIGRCLELLIPDFNVPQPQYHYYQQEREIDEINEIVILSRLEKVPFE